MGKPASGVSCAVPPLVSGAFTGSTVQKEYRGIVKPEPFRIRMRNRFTRYLTGDGRGPQQPGKRRATKPYMITATKSDVGSQFAPSVHEPFESACVAFCYSENARTQITSVFFACRKTGGVSSFLHPLETLRNLAG